MQSRKKEMQLLHWNENFNESLRKSSVQSSSVLHFTPELFAENEECSKLLKVANEPDKS